MNGKPCMRCALAKGTTPLRDLSLKAVEVFGILGFLCRSRPRPPIHTSPGEMLLLHASSPYPHGAIFHVTTIVSVWKSKPGITGEL